MKKIVLSIVIAAASFISASAQTYLGGNLGVWCDNSGSKNLTTYSISPEIGYELNSKWEIGLSIGLNGGFKQDGDNSAFSMNVTPYARYIFAKAGKVDFFCDGAVGITAGNCTGIYDGSADFYDGTDSENRTAVSVGLKPGFRFNMTDNWSLISHIGFLGYSSNDDHVFGAMTPGFGFVLQNAVSFGLFYHF